MAVELGREGGRVVVGVDGSDSSIAALRWAVKQAALTGAEVAAVTAWHIPVNYGSGYTITVPIPDLEKAAAKIAADALAQVADIAPDVKIRTLIVQENAARALLNAAKDADLLVVGSRGHGGFTEALLGSVGQHCVHHAACPVVVMRSPRSA
jgi:nucleotide-binding universal stress UspA family protein